MNDKKKIAVITGASSGLGREFVRQLDESDTDLEEMWVIARREELLNELREQTETPLRVLPYDLTAADTMDRIRALLEEEKPDIRLLINAAGMGRIGRTAEMPLSAINRMIDLNCRAAVDLTQICLPYMREDSHVMEICSVAAFQPIQYLNIYAASKAFLYRYSRALRTELLPKKIYVTAVCPYWIKDTEFIGNTGNDSTRFFHSFPFSSTVEDVAACALAHTRLGAAVCTPGPIAFLDRLFGKVLSSDLMMAIIGALRRIPERRSDRD